MFPAVVIGRGVPTSRFPILELTLTTGGEANTRSLECSMTLQHPQHERNWNREPQGKQRV